MLLVSKITFCRWKQVFAAFVPILGAEVLAEEEEAAAGRAPTFFAHTAAGRYAAQPASHFQSFIRNYADI